MKRIVTVIVGVLVLICVAVVAQQRKPPVKIEPKIDPRPDIGRPQLPFFKRPGHKFQAGDPAKPAVLLFHGLHRDIRCWTNPGDDEGVLCYTFRDQLGSRSLGAHDYPGVGTYKVGVTDTKLEINQNNFFDYLASKGLTVAAFSQAQPMIADAMATANEAYDAFLEETRKLNPASPPPVCLLGHSRGGLVIRQLLKDRGSAPRVKWVITLHSPHGGSDVARTPKVVEQKIRERVSAAMPQIGIVDSEIGKQVEDDVIKALRPLFVYLDSKLDDESRELAPDSEFMTQLAQGEKPIEGVHYFTFGGGECNYMRLYYWTFTAGSAVPQYKVGLEGAKQYFKWEVVPHEIKDASPIYADVAQKILPEVTAGKGDGLVSIERSKLHWTSTHKLTDLNHAEVLFDRGIQRQVAEILLGPALLADVSQAVALPTAQASTGVELPRDLAAATTGPATAPAAKGIGGPALASRTTPNPQLKGRLGRIVVAFPKDSPCKGTHVTIRKDGDAANIEGFYGSGEAELMPGNYTVIINAKPLPGIAVRSRNDTKVTTGVLQVHAGEKTHVQLLDADGKTRLISGYGEQQWGLPVGKYLVLVAGSSEPVQINEDQVTEF
jgi:hypothetical protein